MRMIKFRAWRKALGYMIYNVQNAYDTRPNPNIVDSRGVEIDYDEDCFGNFLENPCYELMQFTGLHDKNGQEIFEGDIVRNSYKYAQPDVCQVIIEGGNTYLSGEDLSTGGDMLLGDYADQCEVLGNIFETPKLLEAPK